MENYLSARGAGKILGVSGVTVSTWCKQGRIPGAIKMQANMWLIPESSLDKIDRPKMGRPPINVVAVSQEE